MGLLTQMIDERHAKERDESSAKVAAYKHILSSEDAQPQAKQYALEQLLDTAKIKGKDKGPVSQMFTHLLGIGKQNPEQKAQTADKKQFASTPQDLYDPAAAKQQPIAGTQGLPGETIKQPQTYDQQLAGEKSQKLGITPPPKRFFKTTQEQNEEELAYEQKRQQILTDNKAALQAQSYKAKKDIEAEKESARINGRKTMVRDVPKSSTDPTANPWDYITIEHHGDGSESILPGKRPAFAEKTYKDAQAYAATHPESSIRQAWDMILNGQVDMEKLRRKNVESTMDNRSSIKARRDATPIGGSGRKGGGRTDAIDDLESKELAAAGGDPAKALANVKGHADKAKEFYGKLYGPLIGRLKVKAGKATGSGDAFKDALGGGGTKQGEPQDGATKEYKGHTYKFNAKLSKWVLQQQKAS